MGSGLFPDADISVIIVWIDILGSDNGSRVKELIKNINENGVKL